jgi:hypothetical protein
MYDTPFDRSFLQLWNGIRHVMPSTDTKPELTAKASTAQPVSQPAVYANGLRQSAQDVGKVDSPTQRPALPPRKYSWYLFLLEAESTTGT